MMIVESSDRRIVGLIIIIIYYSNLLIPASGVCALSACTVCRAAKVCIRIRFHFISHRIPPYSILFHPIPLSFRASKKLPAISLLGVHSPHAPTHPTHAHPHALASPLAVAAPVLRRYPTGPQPPASRHLNQPPAYLRRHAVPDPP